MAVVGSAINSGRILQDQEGNAKVEFEGHIVCGELVQRAAQVVRAEQWASSLFIGGMLVSLRIVPRPNKIIIV